MEIIRCRFREDLGREIDVGVGGGVEMERKFHVGVRDEVEMERIFQVEGGDEEEKQRERLSQWRWR